jgi:hypothetical protein
MVIYVILRMNVQMNRRKHVEVHNKNHVPHSRQKNHVPRNTKTTTNLRFTTESMPWAVACKITKTDFLHLKRLKSNIVSITFCISP